MSEAVLEHAKTKSAAAARTTQWLDTVLQAARKDEEKLKRFLELRRMKRRLRLGLTRER